MTLNVNDDENFFNKEISLQNDKCDDIDHCLSVSMDVAENWKHCKKISFKCVNNTIRPNFKEKFAEICTWGSRKQCMGPIKKMQTCVCFLFSAIQTHPN